jgi:DNA-binding NtrC family response regulator
MPHVLIVDTHKALRDSIESALRSQDGLRFSYSEHGRQALDRLSWDLFDLVVLGPSLPASVTNGIRLCARGTRGVPVLDLAAVLNVDRHLEAIGPMAFPSSRILKEARRLLGMDTQPRRPN